MLESHKIVLSAAQELETILLNKPSPNPQPNPNPNGNARTQTTRLQKSLFQKYRLLQRKRQLSKSRPPKRMQQRQPWRPNHQRKERPRPKCNHMAEALQRRGEKYQIVKKDVRESPLQPVSSHPRQARRLRKRRKQRLRTPTSAKPKTLPHRHLRPKSPRPQLQPKRPGRLHRNQIRLNRQTGTEMQLPTRTMRCQQRLSKQRKSARSSWRGGVPDAVFWVATVPGLWICWMTKPWETEAKRKRRTVWGSLGACLLYRGSCIHRSIRSVYFPRLYTKNDRAALLVSIHHGHPRLTRVCCIEAICEKVTCVLTCGTANRCKDQAIRTSALQVILQAVGHFTEMDRSMLR